jgi:hypothetical protein
MMFRILAVRANNLSTGSSYIFRSYLRPYGMNFIKENVLEYFLKGIVTTPSKFMNLKRE